MDDAKTDVAFSMRPYDQIRAGPRKLFGVFDPLMHVWVKQFRVTRSNLTI